MSWYKPTSLLDKIFEGGIIIKGISGLLELIGGFLLLFMNPDRLKRLLEFVTQRHIVNDPHNRFDAYLLHITQHFSSGSKAFGVAYLWIHAVIKLVAVIGILQNRLWAYPFSLIMLGLFIIYQLYSIIVDVSLGMILLTIFDVLIVWLIWHEYGKAKIEFAKKQEPA